MLTWETTVEAQALYARGWTKSAIARHLGINRRTVREYLKGQQYGGARRDRYLRDGERHQHLGRFERVMTEPTLDWRRGSAPDVAAGRQEVAPTVDATASLVRPHRNGQSPWWTWAGGRANSVLATALSQVEPGLVDELSQYDNRYVKLPGAATPAAVASAVARARD